MAIDESNATPDEQDVDIPDDTVLVDPSTDEEADTDTAEADESDTAEDETSEDPDKGESEDSSEQAEAKEGNESEGDEETSPEDKDSVDQKEQARQRYLERQAARRNQPDPYVSKIYEAAEQELQKIEDDKDRRIAAIEVKEQLREIQEVRSSLVTDNEFARRDFEVFNPKSESFNENAYDHFLQEYEAAYVVKDKQGEVIGTRGPSLYQYLAEKADLVSNLTQAGARKESTARAKMTAQAVTPSAARPTSTGNDLDDLEARIGNIELT
jgi:hypothetical protein